MFFFAFWLCAFIVLYTYVGYAVIIYLLSKLKASKNQYVSNDKEIEWPSVTICIAAYNEEDVIPMKMQNCLELDYPIGRIKFLWVIDGSTDDSYKLLSSYPDVQILYNSERLGKTNAINRAMQEVKTKYVVFTDANCKVSKNSLKLIVEGFEQPEVGCIAGEKRISFTEDDATSSKGEGFYWKYESWLKEKDSQYNTAIGAAGELFAIRSELFVPIPDDTLLDDFMISMQIAKAGYKIKYLSEAYAVESGSLNIEEEKKRKVRIAAGGWQSVWRLRSLLNVFVYKSLSFQYISHRVLRWTISPFALFLLFPLNFIIAFLLEQGHNSFYVCIFILQSVFYILALIGYLKRNSENVPKLYYVPFYFVFMNYNVFEGLIYLKNKSAIWEKSKRKM